MGRTGRGESRHLSINIPREMYDDISSLARLRGIDVSAVINWILSDYRPVLSAMRQELMKECPDILNLLRLYSKTQDKTA